MIERLPPATKPHSLTIEVNARLRPYFEAWYMEARLDGETPEQFALRILKKAAIDHHLETATPKAVEIIEQEKAAEIEALGDDITVLSSELNET